MLTKTLYSPEAGSLFTHAHELTLCSRHKILLRKIVAALPTRYVPSATIEYGRRSWPEAEARQHEGDMQERQTSIPFD